MPIGLFRKDSKPGVSVVIVSASCCMPGMEPFDEQARRAVQQAIAETGVEARVEVMPATTAFFGGLPRSILAEAMRLAQSGRMPMPAVLVNGKPVSYGVPEVAELKAALLACAAPNAQVPKGEPQ